MRWMLAFLSLPVAQQLDLEARPRMVSATTTMKWSPLANPMPSKTRIFLPLRTPPPLPRPVVTQTLSLPILEDRSDFARLMSYITHSFRENFQQYTPFLLPGLLVVSYILIGYLLYSNSSIHQKLEVQQEGSAIEAKVLSDTMTSNCELEKENSKLRKQCEDEKKIADSEKKEQSTVHETEKEELRKRISILEEDAEVRRKPIPEDKKEEPAAQSTITELRKSNHDLNEQIVKLCSQVSFQDPGFIRQKELKILGQEEVIADYKETISILERNLFEQEALVAGQAIESQDDRKLINDLLSSDENGYWTSQIDSLTKEADWANTQHSMADFQFRELEKRLTGIRTDGQEEIDIWKVEGARLFLDRNHLLTQNGNLEDRVELLEKQESTLQEQIQELKTSLSAVRAENESLKSRLEPEVEGSNESPISEAADSFLNDSEASQPLVSMSEAVDDHDARRINTVEAEATSKVNRGNDPNAV